MARQFALLRPIQVVSSASAAACSSVPALPLRQRDDRRQHQRIDMVGRQRVDGCGQCRSPRRLRRRAPHARGRACSALRVRVRARNCAERLRHARGLPHATLSTPARPPGSFTHEARRAAARASACARGPRPTTCVAVASRFGEQLGAAPASPSASLDAREIAEHERLPHRFVEACIAVARARLRAAPRVPRAGGRASGA